MFFESIVFIVVFFTLIYGLNLYYENTSEKISERFLTFMGQGVVVAFGFDATVETVARLMDERQKDDRSVFVLIKLPNDEKEIRKMDESFADLGPRTQRMVLDKIRHRYPLGVQSLGYPRTIIGYECFQ